MQDPNSLTKPRVQPVSVWVRGGKLVVCPDTADIIVGDAVEWVFRPNADDELVQIDFEDKNGQRGPFPKKPNDPHNPSDGVYTTTGKGEVVTAPAAETRDSMEYWKYTVTLRYPQGDIVRLDPIIIVRATQT